MYKETNQLKTIIQYVDYWAGKNSSSIALLDPDTTITYLELKNKIIATQQYSKKIGLKQGDTIALSGPRSVELVLLYLSFWGMGISVVPLPETNLNNNKTKTICELTDANYILIHSNLSREWKLYNSEDFFGNSNHNPYKVIQFASIMEESAELVGYSLIDVDDANYFNLTSGSTGDTKAIKVGDKELIFNAMQLNKVFFMDVNDCHCCIFSTDMHPHELFIRPILTGSKALLLPSNQLRNFRKYLTDYTITHLLTTPYTIKHLIQFAPDKDDWENVKYILAGGENVSLSLRMNFYEVTNKKLLIAWGSTETNGIVIATPESLSLDDKNILGLPIPGYEVQVDPVTSELLIKGNSCMTQYWKTDHSPLTIDGYYPTGDLAEIDEEGIIYHKGRNNSIIKAGGRKVSLYYIESEIERIKGVSDSVVVYGQEESTIFIFISFQKEEREMESLLNKIRNLVSKELESTRFRIMIEDQIPKLPNGKKDRGLLASSYTLT